MRQETTASAVWDQTLLANPHAVADKRRRVQKMFSAIAPSYDLNNRLHSLWMDQRWRRKAVKLAEVKGTDRVVDVACGTGDLTLAMGRKVDRGGPAVVGVDFTFEMLPIARGKAASREEKNPHPNPPPEYMGREKEGGAYADRRQSQFIWLNGDALALPFEDGFADVVSIAFGIRNVTDPGAALKEFRRVLRPGGRVIVLEFSLPTNFLLRGFYNFYFRKILPRTATWISGDRTGAYKYLPQSVNTFINRETMVRMMEEAGFTGVSQHPMTFGVCVCYRGIVEKENLATDGAQIGHR